MFILETQQSLETKAYVTWEIHTEEFNAWKL